MKSGLTLCMSLALSAMVAALPVGAAPERIESLARLATDGTFDCRGPASGQVRLPKCDGVPIIVLRLSSGGCLAMVPYHELRIFTKKAAMTVTWQLIGPTGFKFASSHGIAITPASNPVYSNPRVSAQGTKFSWDVVANAAQNSYQHVANVLDENNRPCTPVDPIIVNDPN